MAVSVSAVDIHDHVADWGCDSLQLPSIVGDYCANYHKPGKRSNFKAWFLLNAHRLCTIVKSKNHEWIPCGTIYISSTLMVKRKYSDCSFFPPQGMNKT